MGVSELSLARKMTDLYVGNLSWETTSEGLQAHLSQYGSVVDCDTGTVRNGRTRGWAIVKMGSGADAENVIQSCHDVEFDGRPLTVRQDAQPEGGGRGGDPNLEGKPENSSGLQIVVRNLPWSVTT